MLQETPTTALKEWAVTQRSLLEGHQIVLLRGGGIVEEAGDFDLKAKQFLIYPAYAHETERAGCGGDSGVRPPASPPTKAGPGPFPKIPLDRLNIP